MFLLRKKQRNTNISTTVEPQKERGKFEGMCVIKIGCFFPLEFLENIHTLLWRIVSTVTPQVRPDLQLS